MKPDVLETNLQRLFARAYAPVRPAPEFRASLRLALARAERTASRTANAPRAPARRVLVAAAVLLALGATVFLLLRSGAERGATSLDDVLASGRPATRADAAPWRALDDAEAARGFEHAGGHAEFATPPERALQVWLGADGSAALAGGTLWRADFDRGAHALDAALVRGGLVLERLAAGGPWTVDTTQGRFELVRGVLELEFSGPELADGSRSLRARLVAGEARFHSADGPIALAAGGACFARAGALVAGGAPADRPSTAPAAASRHPAAAVGAETTVDAGAQPPVAPTGRIELTLALPIGAHAPAGGVATLLAKPRLPKIGEPIVRELPAGATSCAWDGLDAGPYELFAQVEGFGLWRAGDVVLGAGESLALVARLGPGARVRGRVVDARTSTPIEGAQIVSETDAPSPVLPFDFEAANGPDTRTWSAFTRSGPDGTFALDALSAGRHVVRAWAPGRGAEWSAAVLLEPRAEPIELEFRLAPGGALAGRWLDPRGRPRAGQRVIASRIDFAAPRRCISYAMLATDADGRFEARDLAPGMYAVLSVEDGRPSPSMQQVVVRAGATTEIALGATERGAELHGLLQRPGGAPAANVDVSIQRAGERGTDRFQSERTDAEGRFVLHGLLPGRYELYGGLEFGARIAFVAALDVLDVNEVRATFVVGAASLRGVASVAATSAPLTNATVVLQRENAEAGGVFEFGARATSNAKGAFSAELLAAGRWRGVAYAPGEGLAPVRIAPFTLAAGTEPEFALRFERGASATVRVKDEAGQDLPDARVVFVDDAGETFDVAFDDRTNARGELRAPGLPAGAWTVRVFREGSAPLETRIVLDAGDDRELPFTFATTGAPR
ncbi:MAG: carboxypeptidase regulatory-like domain-containing protein [Planctomycetes bacterium]|nr:carboxypeptidase regulatory-like domain-containing protein [Planctomycetota bacterium]